MYVFVLNIIISLCLCRVTSGEIVILQCKYDTNLIPRSNPPINCSRLRPASFPDENLTLDDTIRDSFSDVTHGIPDAADLLAWVFKLKVARTDRVGKVLRYRPTDDRVGKVLRYRPTDDRVGKDDEKSEDDDDVDDNLNKVNRNNSTRPSHTTLDYRADSESKRSFKHNTPAPKPPNISEAARVVTEIMSPKREELEQRVEPKVKEIVVATEAQNGSLSNVLLFILSRDNSTNATTAEQSSKVLVVRVEARPTVTEQKGNGLGLPLSNLASSVTSEKVVTDSEDYLQTYFHYNLRRKRTVPKEKMGFYGDVHGSGDSSGSSTAQNTNPTKELLQGPDRRAGDTIRGGFGGAAAKSGSGSSPERQTFLISKPLSVSIDKDYTMRLAFLDVYKIRLANKRSVDKKISELKSSLEKIDEQENEKTLKEESQQQEEKEEKQSERNYLKKERMKLGSEFEKGQDLISNELKAQTEELRRQRMRLKDITERLEQERERLARENRRKARRRKKIANRAELRTKTRHKRKRKKILATNKRKLRGKVSKKDVKGKKERKRKRRKKLTNWDKKEKSRIDREMRAWDEQNKQKIRKKMKAWDRKVTNKIAYKTKDEKFKQFLVGTRKEKRNRKRKFTKRKEDLNVNSLFLDLEDVSSRLRRTVGGRNVDRSRRMSRISKIHRGPLGVHVPRPMRIYAADQTVESGVNKQGMAGDILNQEGENRGGDSAGTDEFKFVTESSMSKIEAGLSLKDEDRRLIEDEAGRVVREEEEGRVLEEEAGRMRGGEKEERVLKEEGRVIGKDEKAGRVRGKKDEEGRALREEADRVGGEKEAGSRERKEDEGRVLREEAGRVDRGKEEEDGRVLREEADRVLKKEEEKGRVLREEEVLEEELEAVAQKINKRSVGQDEEKKSIKRRCLPSGCQSEEEMGILVRKCRHNPCFNGGICLSINSRKYCVCTGRYTGRRCQHLEGSGQKSGGSPAGLCGDVMCENSGTCKMSDAGQHGCACPALFSGPTCSVRGDPCKMDPCRPYEICVTDETSATSSYICSPRYTTAEMIAITCLIVLLMIALVYLSFIMFHCCCSLNVGGHRNGYTSIDTNDNNNKDMDKSEENWNENSRTDGWNQDSNSWTDPEQGLSEYNPLPGDALLKHPIVRENRCIASSSSSSSSNSGISCSSSSKSSSSSSMEDGSKGSLVESWGSSVDTDCIERDIKEILDNPKRQKFELQQQLVM